MWRDLRVQAWFGHVAGQRNEPVDERAEHLLIDPAAGGGDAVAHVLAQRGRLLWPAIHADDRNVEYAAGGEPIQRWNDHLFGEVPGDAVQHQDLPSPNIHDSPNARHWACPDA
jgi:hypothetical protein